MGKKDNLENQLIKRPKRRINRIINIKNAFLTGLAIGSILTYNTHDKLIELNSLKNYKIAQNGLINPYHTIIERKTINDTLLVYITDKKTNESYELFRNLRLGNFEDRLNSLIGDENDKESIIGKYGQIKESTQDKFKKAYKTVTNFFKKTIND